jgi:hypothetical protein
LPSRHQLRTTIPPPTIRNTMSQCWAHTRRRLRPGSLFSGQRHLVVIRRPLRISQKRRPPRPCHEARPFNRGHASASRASSSDQGILCVRGRFQANVGFACAGGVIAGPVGCDEVLLPGALQPKRWMPAIRCVTVSCRATPVPSNPRHDDYIPSARGCPDDLGDRVHDPVRI